MPLADVLQRAAESLAGAADPVRDLLPNLPSVDAAVRRRQLGTPQERRGNGAQRPGRAARRPFRQSSGCSVPAGDLVESWPSRAKTLRLSSHGVRVGSGSNILRLQAMLVIATYGSIGRSRHVELHSAVRGGTRGTDERQKDRRSSAITRRTTKTPAHLKCRSRFSANASTT